MLPIPTKWNSSDLDAATNTALGRLADISPGGAFHNQSWLQALFWTTLPDANSWAQKNHGYSDIFITDYLQVRKPTLETLLTGFKPVMSCILLLCIRNHHKPYTHEYTYYQYKWTSQSPNLLAWMVPTMRQAFDKLQCTQVYKIQLCSCIQVHAYLEVECLRICTKWEWVRKQDTKRGQREAPAKFTWNKRKTSKIEGVCTS